MTTAEDVLNQARSQIGIKESPANSNRNPYGAWYGVNGVPWCAEFVSWCFAQAGAPLNITTRFGFAYCPYGASYFQKIGRWSTTPSVGAIVFYGSPSVHTGIVESFDAHSITAIEGNTAVGNDANGGEVMRRVRPRNNWILGYGLPQYTAPQLKVKPMYDPPIVMEPWVASRKAPQGGVWGLAASGAVYGLEGAPYLGGANGKEYFRGRSAARFVDLNPEEISAGKVYVIAAQSGERYAYPE